MFLLNIKFGRLLGCVILSTDKKKTLLLQEGDFQKENQFRGEDVRNPLGAESLEQVGHWQSLPSYARAVKCVITLRSSAPR
jgi:hypothetical protein